MIKDNEPERTHALGTEDAVAIKLKQNRPTSMVKLPCMTAKEVEDSKPVLWKSGPQNSLRVPCFVRTVEDEMGRSIVEVVYNNTLSPQELRDVASIISDALYANRKVN